MSNWQAARLTLTAVVGVVVAWRDRDGMVTVSAKPYVVIPAALRRLCRWRRTISPWLIWRSLEGHLEFDRSTAPDAMRLPPPRGRPI